MITASSPRFALRLLFQPILSLMAHYYMLWKLPELTAHFVACFFCGVVASFEKVSPLPDCVFFVQQVLWLSTADILEMLTARCMLACQWRPLCWSCGVATKRFDVTHNSRFLRFFSQQDVGVELLEK